MVISVNDKEYVLRFGIKFLRELDKKRFYENNGAKVGAGLELMAMELFSGNIVALSELIYTATNTEQNRPTQHDIDNYLESLDEKELDKLMDEVIKELKKSSLTSKKIKTMEKAIKEAQKQA